MITAKLGRGISTGIHCQYITIIVCIVHTSHEGGQARIFIIRISSFPRTKSTSLKIVIAQTINTEISNCGIESRILVFLHFRQPQNIKEMLPPFFDVLGLAEVQKDQYSGFYTTVTNFSIDGLGYNNLQGGALRPWEGTNSYYEDPRLASFMGRVNYTYDDALYTDSEFPWRCLFQVWQ